MSPDRPTLLAEPEIRRIGEGLLDCSLPKADWTHAAHCIACLYLMRWRPDIDLDLDLPGIIWRYNLASGTPNAWIRRYSASTSSTSIAIHTP